jgi:YD repeat-containing protein
VVNEFLALFSNFFRAYASPRVIRHLLLLLLLLASASFSLRAQDDGSGEIRASVVLNPDGSRTTYETDAAARKSTAVTTSPEGKVRKKINYDLDENGRFMRGEVLGPKGEFRFFAQYKYNTDNRLSEEIHLDKQNEVIGRILFHYDGAGHQTGYAVYDGAGRLLGETAPAAAGNPAKRK